MSGIKGTHRVYWTDCVDGQVYWEDTTDFVDALSISNAKRKDGHKFVITASEMVGLVGQLGADGVIEGRLPNGDVYDWKKRRP